MSQSTLSISDQTVVTGDTGSAAPVLVRDRFMRWFEVVMVTSAAFLLPLAGSIHALLVGHRGPGVISQWGFGVGALLLVPPMMTLIYVLWRNGRTFRDIGFRWSWKDVGIGFLLTLVAFFTTVVWGLLLRYALNTAGMGGVITASAETVRHTWTRSMLFTPGGAVYLTIVPIFEEVIVRAYLMTELIDLIGSAAVAALVSVLLQSAYHLYYGWLGAATIVAMFVPWAIYFALRRRGTPCAAAHWFFDFLVLLAKR